MSTYAPPGPHARQVECGVVSVLVEDCNRPVVRVAEGDRRGGFVLAAEHRNGGLRIAVFQSLVEFVEGLTHVETGGLRLEDEPPVPSVGVIPVDGDEKVAFLVSLRTGNCSDVLDRIAERSSDIADLAEDDRLEGEALCGSDGDYRIDCRLDGDLLREVPDVALDFSEPTRPY